MQSDPTVLTAQSITDRTGGRLEGDGSQVVRCIETLENAEEGMLTWVGSPEFVSMAAETRASVILMPLEGEAPPEKTIIRVADPDLTMCEVLKILAPSHTAVAPGVHPTAVIGSHVEMDEGVAIGPHVVVEEGATIERGTRLHAGVFVGRETRIGVDCTLWPNVVVREFTTIGARVVIHPNATIGADGFSYIQRDGKNIKVPQIGRVVIEDDVEIGANSTIDRARSGTTIIRRDTKIDNLVMIAHNCDIGEGSLLAAMTGIAGSTKLGKHVACGGQAGIIDHLDIGDGAQIGAASCALTDIPEGLAVRGVPARDHMRVGREQVAVRKLPEILKLIQKLERRVRELERVYQKPD
ncbi:MAG: UDP-3-O-(3-hydroxymyristoyl)glucosamine N-acyltransferase [Planctomycetota bacterium]|jgi:UDP-3-O-[3-hydroxymyristoyl] glucosamine N-acyltransferase